MMGRAQQAAGRFREGYHARMAPPVVPTFATHSQRRTTPESRIVDTLVFHNWPQEERARAPEAARRTVREALARWRELGLPFAPDARGEPCYDPAEVALVMRVTGYEGGDPYWRQHHVSSLRGLILSLHPPGTPDDVAPRVTDLPARRVVMTMERRFHPAYLAPRGRLRLPVPQVDDATRNLEVTLDPVPGIEEPPRLTNDYAEVRLDHVPAEPVVMRARYAFDAYPSVPAGPAAVLSPADRELYLRPHEDLVQVTPGIVALAASLSTGAATPFEQVHRFYSHVTKRLDLGPFPYALLDLEPPTHYPPQMGWFDCRRLSAFLVALCRAAGFPARRATGYLLYPACVNYHHWTEVWLDGQGWLSIDQLSAEAAAVHQDPPWRDALVGAVDYRMKMGYMPRAFNGSPGVRLPAAWTSLEVDADGATQTDIIDTSHHALVWTDTLRVELGAPVSAR